MDKCNDRRFFMHLNIDKTTSVGARERDKSIAAPAHLSYLVESNRRGNLILLPMLSTTHSFQGILPKGLPMEEPEWKASERRLSV
jgi:hypothetical protein